MAQCCIKFFNKELREKCVAMCSGNVTPSGGDLVSVRLLSITILDHN